MSRPDNRDDVEFKFPTANFSRQEVFNRFYSALGTIRTKQGIDPKRYPPVDSDIQYDVRSTIWSADIIAYTTAELLRPAILTGQMPGRWSRTKALLRHPLTAAAIIIAAMVIYLDSRTSEKPTARHEYERAVGAAILRAKPEIQTSMGETEITITISGNLLKGEDTSIKLNHDLSEAEFERLRQEFKK